MAVDFSKRFDELLQQANEIEAKKTHHTEFQNAFVVDRHEFLNWCVKSRHLIGTVCGQGSYHLVSFVKHEDQTGMGITSHYKLRNLVAVLQAAKEDYEGGYLNEIRNLIQSDVFDNELEQAEELLSAGYHVPAAVVAGVVLETTLRQMCEENQIATGKLDRMNADLAKAGAFNTLVQKQITAWAAIRNSAAHGQVDQFKPDDVAAMIRDVRRFLAERLS